jgi:two-component system chemotaxis sensor kinase CheA
MDEEILQDFLVEAREILEALDSQLIALEAAPHERELLNAVFRAFHTLKGGAGFLNLEALVAVAHRAEDVFDRLRNGRATLDAVMMDVFLQVLDTLREMFGDLNRGQLPLPAAPALMESLRLLAAGEPLVDATPAAGEFGDVVAAMIAEAGLDANGAASDLVDEDEFEALLDRLQAKPPAAEAAASELITDDEFEALLDRLQAGEAVPVPAAPAAGAAQARTEAESDVEFARLLDSLPGLRGCNGESTTFGFQPTTAFGGDTPPRGFATTTAFSGETTALLRSGHVRRGDGGMADNTVRVGTDVLDRIMNMVGELVLIRNRLSNLQASIGNPEVTQAVASLDVVTSDLQMAAMKTRMQPIRKVFGRFPRVVRDLARSLRKEIKLEMAGEDTDLDKTLVEALADPLVHLVRNAVDHGIETPAERLAAGKPREGTLRLAAEQDGDQILLTIEDDGHGMNADVLRAKAVEKGLLEPDAALRLTPRECFELIFLPGFSTRSEISDVSGRGVGMDVVKTRITQLNGSIEIDSRVNIGTTIRIRVPLTLAIMPTLMVVLGRQIFALPLVNVKEIIDFERSHARDVNGSKTLLVRGKALPLFYLSRWLVNGVHDYAVDNGHVVIVSVGNQSMGLLVDELIGQEEVVIKPLGAMLQGTRGLSGATITGNGRIALILDLPELIDAYARR